MRDYLVDIRLIKAETAREAVEEFVDKKTEHLEKPTREIGTEQVRKKQANSPAAQCPRV